MPKTVEFFFDLGSPASYLAFTQLGILREDTGAEIVLKPMLLGGVFKATGNQSPVMIPAKGAYFLRDMTRYAEHYGVALTLPPGFPLNTLAWMRACAGLIDTPALTPFVATMYDALFARGLAMGDAVVAAEAMRAGGFDPDMIAALSDDPASKERLKALTEEAVSRGAFGAPTFFVGDEMFFGQDRLEWVRQWVRQAAR